MDATTARLADFATRSEFRALPAATVHECKRRLIDTLACAFAAYDEPLCVKARAMAQRHSGNPGAGVWGCTWQTAPEMAAFANGVMMRYLDMMDTHLGKTRAHPSELIPGLLAVGETVHADGAAVINAITLGYDVFCSFCDAIDINSQGWDQPVCGVIACALGAGKLLGLTHEQMGNAVALALAPNMALFNTRRGELSHWKGCAGANGSRNAVFAAFLAKEDFTGPTAIFEGRDGLWDTIGKFEWPLPAGPGAIHGVAGTHMKCFPIAYHAQPAAWAGIEVRQRLRVQDISEIRIETYRLAMEITGSDPSCWAPKTHERADHSLPYVLAVALLDGAISSDSFTEAKLADPAIHALMRKISIHENADLTARFPAATPCRLNIRMASGEEITTEVSLPKGHANNPLSDADLEEKFRGLFRTYGTAKQCDAILRALWDFDRVADIGDVSRLFVRS